MLTIDIDRQFKAPTGHDSIPDDKARYSREHVGSEYIGWLHFQTIWNQLLIDQPDMFD